MKQLAICVLSLLVLSCQISGNSNSLVQFDSEQVQIAHVFIKAICMGTKAIGVGEVGILPASISRIAETEVLYGFLVLKIQGQAEGNATVSPNG